VPVCPIENDGGKLQRASSVKVFLPFGAFGLRKKGFHPRNPTHGAARNRRGDGNRECDLRIGGCGVRSALTISSSDSSSGSAAAAAAAAPPAPESAAAVGAAAAAYASGLARYSLICWGCVVWYLSVPDRSIVRGNKRKKKKKEWVNGQLL